MALHGVIIGVLLAFGPIFTSGQLPGSTCSAEDAACHTEEWFRLLGHNQGLESSWTEPSLLPTKIPNLLLHWAACTLQPAGWVKELD